MTRPPAAGAATGAWSPTLRALLIIALLVTPLCLLNLGAWGFYDPDEGRYAEIPREMLAARDMLTPTLNGVLYFEKPPLLYWLVAGACSAFGFDEWAARLVPALSALLAVLVAWRLGRRMFGERAGLLGAVILASNLFWTFLARYLSIDMLFTSLLFVALACWWCGHTERGWRAWVADAAFWIALGLAALAKGPVAVVLAGGTMGTYALLCRRISCLGRPSLLLTAPLLAAVAAPWFVLVSQRNPGFDHFFWYEQHVGRFLGESNRGFHEHGVFYFIGFLPALLLPWTTFLPGAILDGWRSLLPARTERGRAAVFLLGGAAFVTLFFSASSGKLLPYVLPVIPLVALPLGAWFDRLLDQGAAAWRAPLRRGAYGLAAILLALAAGALVFGPEALRRDEDRGPGLLVLPVLALVGVAALVFIAARRRALTALLASIAGGMALLIAVISVGAAAVGPNHSCEMLVRHVQPGLDAGAELITYRGYLPGLCFYSRRRLFVNDDPGELTFGSQQIPPAERERWFADSADVVARQLAAPGPIYCVVRDHERAEQLIGKLGPGVQEIVWNKRRSIVGNAAAAALTPPVGRVGAPRPAGGDGAAREAAVDASRDDPVDDSREAAGDAPAKDGDAR